MKPKNNFGMELAVVGRKGLKMVSKEHDNQMIATMDKTKSNHKFSFVKKSIETQANDPSFESFSHGE